MSPMYSLPRVGYLIGARRASRTSKSAGSPRRSRRLAWRADFAPAVANGVRERAGRAQGAPGDAENGKDGLVAGLALARGRRAAALGGDGVRRAGRTGLRGDGARNRTVAVGAALGTGPGPGQCLVRARRTPRAHPKAAAGGVAHVAHARALRRAPRRRVGMVVAVSARLRASACLPCARGTGVAPAWALRSTSKPRGARCAAPARRARGWPGGGFEGACGAALTGVQVTAVAPARVWCVPGVALASVQRAAPSVRV